MQTIPISREYWREFRSVGRPSTKTLAVARNPEQLHSRCPGGSTTPVLLVWDKGRLVTGPRSADRGLPEEGDRESRRKGINSLAAIRERDFAFEQEAAFSSTPPFAFSQSESSDPLHKRVLVADDDSVVRGSLVAVLESEGYVVDEARNGIEAVRSAVEHSPDLALLDLNMPHWDGWTAFSHLDRVSPMLPVVVITARPNQYREAVRRGVDAFMEKPLNIPLLMRAIRCLTSEDKHERLCRVAHHSFVTRLLSDSDS